MKIIFVIILSTIFTLSVYSQFTDYQSPFTGRLNSGDFSSQNFQGSFPQILWICGDSGIVFKVSSTFGTPQFRYVNNGIPSTIMLRTMCAIDTNTALVAGMNGSNTFVYRTSNSGTNWAQVFTQSGGFINSIWFKSLTTGFMAGNPVGGRWSFWRTTNAGVTWDSSGRYLPQAGSELGNPNSMRTYGDSIWMGTNNSRLYFSTNFGSNWIVRSTAPLQNINTISFSNINLVYIGGDSLLNSYDWGTTWSVIQNISGTGPVTGMVMGNPGVDDPFGGPVFYSKADKIYYNQFSNWPVFHTAQGGVFTYLFKGRERVPFGNFTPMIGLKTNGGIWICNCAWGGITTIGTNIPSEFMLHQNYPNPFNPATKIRFDVPVQSAGNVKLAVYDILGNKVVMLVNEHLAAGTYEAEFDGSNISSGLYFYKLEADDYTETKKMLLVK